MSAPVLELREVCHAYDQVPVLVDVSLTLREGEQAFVIGANGAGKSTLAFAAAGLIEPRAGSVWLFGDDITGARAHAVARLGLSYTPAYRSVFPYMSVRENLELGAEVLARFRGRQTRDFVSQRLDYVLTVFPALRDHLAKDAVVLSGGLQRMVEVGRALMGAPRVLVLDEPTLGMAGGVMHDLAEGLSHLAGEGTTILVIEQNVPFAADICERGYLMHEGRITLTGSSEELLDSEAVRQTYLGVL